MYLRFLVFGAAAGASLLMAACGDSTASTVPSSSAATSSVAATTAPAGSVAVREMDFMITVPSSVPSGSVTFAVNNAGPTPHQFTVEDSSGRAVGATPVLSPNTSTTLTLTLQPGTYTYLCALPGHASLGMHGMFTVS